MTGLYVHVPFCARACPYCDFDFEVDARPDADAFLVGLGAEVDARPDVDVAFDTVYLGGGTPSVLGPEGLDRLLAWLRQRLDTGGALEWTVELNPEHVDAPLVDALVAGGVHRVSLGVQSLHPAGLRQLGRAHGRAEALAAIERCARAGLRVSADLIVGWPGQTDAPSEVAALPAVEHVSVYALTIEEGTPWTGLVERGLRALPDADAQTDALLATEATLTAAGFTHYEIASYRRTAAATSQHNLHYWTWRDYVGLGPSAASAAYRDGSVIRRTNRRGLAAWRRAEPPAIERLHDTEAAAEGLWLGLRVLTGLDLAGLQARFPEASPAWVAAATARQRELGNLVLSEDEQTLSVAPGRWLFHDAIAADLLARPRSRP